MQLSRQVRWDLPDGPQLSLEVCLWGLVFLSDSVSSSISPWLQSFPFSWDGHLKDNGLHLDCTI